MRNYPIKPSQRSLAFTNLLEILEESGYRVLDRDGIEFVIDAIEENPASANKHIGIAGVKDDEGTIIRVEIRNMGLELIRDKSNDLLEIKLLRKLHKALLQDSKKFKSIRLSA